MVFRFSYFLNNGCYDGFRAHGQLQQTAPQIVIKNPYGFGFFVSCGPVALVIVITPEHIESFRTFGDRPLYTLAQQIPADALTLEIDRGL